jgi:uncharacterized protein YndB with AHSA1/START domain
VAALSDLDAKPEQQSVVITRVINAPYREVVEPERLVMTMDLSEHPMAGTTCLTRAATSRREGLRSTRSAR